MKLNKEAVAMGLLAGELAFGTFGNFVPTIPEIKERAHEREFCRGVRQAYMHAGVSSLVLAGVVSLLAESPLPLVGWGVGTAAAVATYEMALPSHKRLLVGTLLSLPDPNVIDGQYRVID